MSRSRLLIPAAVVALVALFGAGYGGVRALDDGERPVGTVTLPAAVAGASATVRLPSFSGTVPAPAREATTTSSASSSDTGTGAGSTGTGTGGGTTTFSFGSD